MWSKVRIHCTWKRELLPIKMILFLYTGGMVAFLPFLTLHMKQLGITVKEIAIIHAFLPVASLLGPPISGLVADIFGKYRAVLCGNILLTLILHCLLLQVPQRPKVTFTLTCAENGHALTWGYCSACHGANDLMHPNSPPLTLTECRSTCTDMDEKNLQLCLHGDSGNTNNCHTLNYTSQLTLHGSLLSWLHDLTNTTNTTNTNNPIQAITNSLPLPPESPPLPFTTTTTTTAPTCGHTFTYIKGVANGDGEELQHKEQMKQDQENKERKGDVNNLTSRQHIKTKEKQHQGKAKTNTVQKQDDSTSRSNKKNTGRWRGLTCPNLPSTCPLECKVEGFPTCDHPEDPSQYTLTFWVYFAIRLLGTFFLASSFTMMDATSLALVKQHDAEFGKQRILSTIGQATVPLLAGILVDAHSASLGYSDYMPAIYLGSSLALVATLIVLRLDVQVETGSDNVLQDLRKLVTKIEIDLFLLMILILGSNWGFIESYLFLYLHELNAPNYLLGLTLTVGCITGVPIMYVADTVIDKLGRPAIFIISFFTYAARHFGYAFMTDPWLVFPYELLEIFTYQIMWVAAATYCPVLAPKGLLATMTGLAGSVHYSLGRGLGSLFGGYLIANIGLQETFKIFGYISLSGGVFYSLLHYFYLRKKIPEREEEEKKEEKIKDEELPMMQLGLRRGSEGFAP